MVWKMIDLKQEKIIAEQSHKIVETFLWWGQDGALIIAAFIVFKDLGR